MADSLAFKQLMELTDSDRLVLLDCAKRLRQLHDQASTSVDSMLPQMAVHEKFRASKWHQVSLLSAVSERAVIQAFCW